MNEVNVAGLNAVEEAMRDDKPVYAEPKVVPKKFERLNDLRRNTVELPALSDAERAVRERIDAKLAAGHSPIPLPPSAYDAHSPIDAIIAAHESSHGDFTGNATTAQGLKYVMRRGKNWEAMPPWMHEALEQMQTKVARILAGDFNDPDHWKDLQGYPRLVETRLDTK